MTDVLDDVLDAVVVGYGPVGAVAAGLLGQAGLRTAVFESTTSVYHLPRAAHFDAEIMRVLQELGVADDVLPACAPVEGMHFINAAGDALLRFDLDAGAGWMFYQPDLESALRAGVDRSGHVAVHLAHEVTSLVQHDDHVEIAVTDLVTNTRRTVRSRYVIGADGARSAIRRELGIASEDLKLDQPWLVVDTILRRPIELPTRVLQICDPARPTTFIPMCGARRRWEFMLLPDEDAEEMESPPRIAELLAQWVTVDDVEIVRAVVYTFHAVLARSWRDRRVFLIGDAAHQMPPFLGQGMCSGVRDAHNLVWKLALVASARAPDALLDTYQQERSPHVRSIIETAVALGGLPQTTDPEVAAARDATMIAGPHEAPPAAMPGLAAGVIADGGGWRFSGAGTGFELIAPHDVDVPDDVADWWQSIGGRFTVDGSRQDTILVRPDRYVFGSSGDATALLNELRSKLTPHLASAR